MDENKGYKIYCSRCGAEMGSKSRYCMKCGNLNYDHEENKSMRPYLDKQANTYEVGSGNFIGNDNNKSTISIGNNTGNRNVCYYINFSVYLVIIFISLLFTLFSSGFSLDGFLNSVFPYISMITSFVFLYVYSLELTFIKCNERWWGALIPIYNLFILSEIVFGKKSFGIIALIPIVGVIYLLVLVYNLGKKFKYSGLLTVLFPIIFLPIIGFGSSLYEGHNYVEYGSTERNIEIEYKRKKSFLSIIILFFLIGIGLVAYNKMSDLEEGGQDIFNYYYVYASNIIVKKTQKAVNENRIKCELTEYNNNDGVYYINFVDFGDYMHLPFYFLREIIGGYIKIDNTKGDNRYYISLTDGEYGISETLVENVDTSSVIKFGKLKTIPDDANICSIVGK